jgi:DNA-binding XRE family transcriptional regulator
VSRGDAWWLSEQVSRVEWERLGALVRRDRVRLGMRTQGELAARAGVSKRTVSDIERAARANFSADTLGAVEAALGWEPGTVSDVLRGRAPAPDVGLARVAAAWPRLGDRERQIVLAVVDILSGAE